MPAELEHIFRAHHALVFRTAYRITGNAADAEDVLQTIFLRLIGRDGSTGALQNSESYLRRAAVNASLDIVRAKQAASSGPLQDFPTRGDPGELREGLRRALAALKPKAAEMFALRFIEGYSNPQIAAMLGTSQILVAVTLHRTRRQLQTELRSYRSYLGENA